MLIRILLLLSLAVIQQCKSFPESTSGTEEPTCFQAGECTQSIFIGQWTPDDAQGCLTECQNEPECRYFTYYENLGECTGFINCEVFSEDTCSDCYSGEQTCEDLQCWVLGQCTGILLEEVPVATDQQCLDVCKENSTCQWFTYDSHASVCFMFETCPIIEADCATCLSGQKQCSDKKDYTKLMVIGGFNRGALDVVEVVNLDDPSVTCNLVADYPTEIEQLTVGLVNGVVKACGGCNINNCYDYNPSNDRWVSSPGLAMERDFVRSSIIDGTWLVSGDDTIPNGNMTELWTGSQFDSGPELPQLMYGHCQDTINNTYVFFADCESHATYLLNWDSQEWTQLDYMITYRNHYCGCGLINNDVMGKEVVVAGYGTSEIFNLNNLTWRAGPSLPNGNGYASVQLTNTFLLVGGQEENFVYSDKIYIFDEENYVFNLKSQTLLYPRRDAAAVAVDEMVDCS